MIAAAMTAAVLSYVHCANITEGPEFAGGEQVAETRTRLFGSHFQNTVGRNWGRGTRLGYNRTADTYEKRSSLFGWTIAIVIVPLVVVIGIVVLRPYVCRACAGQKGGISHA